MREAFCATCRDDFAEIDEKGRCTQCGNQILEPLKKPKAKAKKKK